jgi:hypothetical protein
VNHQQGGGDGSRSRERSGPGSRAIRADAVLALSAIAVIALRFVVLRRGGAPPTIDAGNWLAFADGMLGEGVRSTTIVYPPVVPLLTKAFALMLGLTNGVALLAAIASAVPAIGAFVALRCLGLGGMSLLPALLVLGASSVGEATAWGGFPQLIGLGLAPIALVALTRALRSWRWRPALATGVAMMAILAVSHLIGLIVAAAAVVLFAAAVVDHGHVPRTWKQGALAAGLVVLPSAWLGPLYWSLARGASLGSGAAVSPGRLTWSNLWTQVEFLYRDSPWLWRIALPLAVAAPLLLWRRWRDPLWQVAAGLLVGTLVTSAVTREARFLYVLTVFTAFGLSLWIRPALEWLKPDADVGRARRSRLRAVTAAGLAVLVAAVGFQFVRSTRFFEQQREHYGPLTPGIVTGIEFLGESTPPGTVVAATSLNNAPLGWWVEAIARRPTVYGSPLAWLSFEDETRRASFANDLFVPPFPAAEKLQAAEEAGIQLILVPTAWAFYEPEAVEDLAAAAPGAVVHLNSEVVILRTEALHP